MLDRYFFFSLARIAVALWALSQFARYLLGV